MGRTIKAQILITICLFTVAFGAHAQENKKLDYALRHYNISLNENEYYTIDKSPNQNKCGDNNCEIHKHIPYGVQMSLLSKDGQCKIYVTMTSLLTTGGDPEWRPEMGEKYYIPGDMTIMDLRIALGWGGKDTFKMERQWMTDNLLSMMTKYPKKKAKKLFNSDFLYSIPLNFYGGKCHDKFSNGRCVITGKRELDMMLYFFMTDNSVKDFDRYLDEIKGVLRYNW